MNRKPRHNPQSTPENRAKVVKALRAGHSTQAIVRAYGIGEKLVFTWRDEEGIAPAKAGGRGPKFKMPDVGEELN